MKVVFGKICYELNSNLGTIYSTFLTGKNEINNWTKISGHLTIPSGVYIIHAKLCSDANNPLSNIDILANDNTIARSRYQTQVTTFYEFTEETTIEVRVHNPSQINYTQGLNNYLQAIRIK